MSTRVVLSNILLLVLAFPLLTSALYFPDGSHNRGNVRPVTGGTVTIDPPTRLIRRQATPSTTLQPVISVQNTTDWANQTNQDCIAAINVTSVINPAGVVPCYNVLSFDPNTGIFISEVRLFQVVSMEQPSVVSSATGSGVLFEFPHATIQDSPSMEQFLQFLDKPTVQKRDTTGQINFVTSFLMNGTASINQNLPVKELVTPTTATLTLNYTTGLMPYSMSDSIVMFVNGLFSSSFVDPTSTNTTASDTSTNTTSSGVVIPGTSFGIVPVGFYLFSAYWGAFTVVILAGVWNKRKYREAFRRRRAAVANFTAGERLR